MSTAIVCTMVLDGWSLDVSSESEPRVRDVDVARKAGLAQPRNVRQIIEKNLAELTAHGEIRVCTPSVQTSGGRPGSEYWLSEAQAMAVVSLLKTKAARELRIAMVKLFVAYRRGQLAAATSPIALEVAHGAHVGEVPNLRSDIAALCAMAARASNNTLHQVHGFVRRTYRVPGIYHVAVLAWPAVRVTLEALALGKIHLSKPRLALPMGSPRQLNLWGAS